MQKQQCRLSGGKVLGGTSTINNLHYHRANQKDFSTWEQPTWNSLDVSTHYQRVEMDAINYGTSDDDSEDRVLKSTIFKSSSRMGYNRMVTNDDNFGYVETFLTINNGIRQNSAKTFLSNLKRKNLKLILQAEVTRVNFTKAPDRKAFAVEVLHKNRKYTLKSLKEIILTAGAINTARILLASGVGPREHLKELQIPLIADREIGFNLQDHFAVPVLVSVNYRGDKPQISERVFQYLMHKTGWLSKINIHDIVGYINTFQAPFDTPNMAIQHYFFENNDGMVEEFFRKLGYTDKIIRSIVKYNRENGIVVFMPTLLKPKSRGRILLSKNDVVIEGNYLSDEMEEDLQTLVTGIGYIMEFIETPDFLKLTPKLLEIDIPNCKSMKVWKEPYLRCLVRNLGFPTSQMVGTVQMETCCDGRDLMVKGVRGLRVVDASVFPEPVTTTNLQATLAMLADRTAELIKEKWKKKHK